jgi:hypothetical protein
MTKGTPDNSRHSLLRAKRSNRLLQQEELSDSRYIRLFGNSRESAALAMSLYMNQAALS